MPYRRKRQEPTYKVEEHAPPWEYPLDPTARWSRRATGPRSEPTVDAYPDREIPWHVVGPPGPSVPAPLARAAPADPVSLYVSRRGKMRQVTSLGLPLEIAVDRLNRRIMAGWVMQEIANAVAALEEDEMSVEDPGQEKRGQGLAEYALILALIAIVTIAVLLILGQQVAAVFQQVADCIPDLQACVAA